MSRQHTTSGARIGRLACLAALLGAVAVLLPARAFYGPPERIPAGASRFGLALNTGHRRVDLDGMINNSIVKAQRIFMTHQALDARASFGIVDDFNVHVLMGAARGSLGSVSFSNAPALGSMGLNGDFGWEWGVGCEYFLPQSLFIPDVTIGLIGQYRQYTSSLTGGSLRGNEARCGLLAGRAFDRITPYLGADLTMMRATYRTISTAGFAASGTVRNNLEYGVLGGVQYQFTDRLKGKAEVELHNNTAFSLGVVYDWGGPWRLPPPSRPVVKDESPVAPPAPPLPAPATAPPTRLDVRASEEQVLRGIALVDEGKVAAALPVFERAAMLDPGSFRARVNLASAYYLTGNYAAARDAYRGAIALQPLDVDAHLYLGFACLRLQDKEGAARAWERVLELDPNNAVALNNLQALKR